MVRSLAVEDADESPATPADPSRADLRGRARDGRISAARRLPGTAITPKTLEGHKGRNPPARGLFKLRGGRPRARSVKPVMESRQSLHLE